VQIVNFVSFAMAVFAFDYLLRCALEWRERIVLTADVAMLPQTGVIVAAYAAFMVIVAYVLNVRTMTPDMIVAAVVFVSSGLLLTAQRTGWRPRDAVAFGVTLAVGYFAKTVMFPVGLIYLIAAVALEPRAWRGPALAAAAFAVVAMPWLVALSLWKGKPTYGETGPLMYASWVNGWAGRFHWTGEPPGSGTPRHPVQQITARPDAFAFDWPARVTYPLFYDPTYWTDGIRATVSVPNQLRALRRTLGELAGILWAASTMIAALAVFVVAASDWRGWRYRLRQYRMIWVPAIGAIALYLAVHIEGRLIAGQLQVLIVTLLATLAYDRARVDAIGQTGAAACLAAAIVTEGPVAAGALRNTVNDLAYGESREHLADWTAAQGFGAHGLGPGDRIAVIGNVIDVSWAQLGQLSIVAELSADQLPAYLAADDAGRSRVIEAFERRGVRAVVARSADRSFDTEPWLRIGGTEFAVHTFGVR
jgi:4-amino-4-deoxy-L-arabinose transferase-like glycosyltransferase